MPTPPTKAELRAAFDEARRNHQAFLATIPRERMTEPGATGPWSVKDVIAHVNAWRTRTVDRLEAVVEDRPLPPPPWPAEIADGDDDPINAWIYERYRDEPLDAVLADWDASFDRIATAITALPEAALFDPTYFPGMEGRPLADAVAIGFLGHFNEEHAPTLRAWLATQE
jgi:hypothetical protein